MRDQLGRRHLARCASVLAEDADHHLVTIALFGTLSFVVNAAMQLVGMGVASVVGPFAFVLTGLFDDTIRAILLITLLMLRPKAGVCGMAILIGWLLRAVTTRAASPADILYLTGHVFLLEASLSLFGLTRGKPLHHAAFVRIRDQLQRMIATAWPSTSCSIGSSTRSGTSCSTSVCLEWSTPCWPHSSRYPLRGAFGWWRTDAARDRS